jgi:hypothetical protein
MLCGNAFKPLMAAVQGCGEKVRFCDLDKHKAESCMKRLVPCSREGCPEKVGFHFATRCEDC